MRESPSVAIVSPKAQIGMVARSRHVLNLPIHMSYFELLLKNVAQNINFKQRNFETGMKWNNSQLDPLPADKSEVLIAVDGVYYISTYDAEKRIFKVEGELKETFFPIDQYQIYWTEYSDPL